MKTLPMFLLVFCAIRSNALAHSKETDKLYTLFDREWEWTLETSSLGDNRGPVVGETAVSTRSPRATSEASTFSLNGVKLRSPKKVDRL